MKYSYRGTALAGFLILFAIASGYSVPPAPSTAETEKPPSPQLVISFERQTMRENDQLPVRVFVSNPSDKNLENVRFSWSALPGTLVLYSKKCTDMQSNPGSNQAATEIPIGELPAQQDPKSVQSLDLCLTSTTVNNGDYNLLFNLRYDWTAKEGPRHSVLTVEKPIKSAFLGTDSLAGVPLALAGFIVPGLLFWLALDAWKTPWRIQGPTLGDKTVYSVLVSLLLVAMVSISPYFKQMFDITQGLSLKKLEYLALLGGVAGMVIGGFDRWIRNIRTRLALHTDDDDLTLLLKLLRLNVGRSKPVTTVQLGNGQIFQGSVGAQDATDTYLMGWNLIVADPQKASQTEEIRKAVKAGDFALAAELASKYKFQIEPRDYIYLRGADGSFGTANPAVTRMQWPNGQVTGKPTVETEKDRDEPLTIN
jgi:hypothetical protein